MRKRKGLCVAALLGVACGWVTAGCGEQPAIRPPPEPTHAGVTGEEGAGGIAKAPPRLASLPPITDKEVFAAFNKARTHLISRQNPDGSWGDHAATSALVFMTLARMGEHPNREVMIRGLVHLLGADTDKDFGGLQGYGVPMRLIGLSHIHYKLLGEKRDLVRRQMMADILRIVKGQSEAGGWRYRLDASDWDFSVTGWVIHAFREASAVGIELPAEVFVRARDLYFRCQMADGGWNYTGQGPPYGSMTAEGLASLYIFYDFLEPAGAGPRKGVRGGGGPSETDRRTDAALYWLSKHFRADENPEAAGAAGKGKGLYWLYWVERAARASGYKYFGSHDWYAEGARLLVNTQEADGSWGSLEYTCLAALFLLDGRAPVVLNKLCFDGAWNTHRRDIANLTYYIERMREQIFHWQIVSLREPLEELHDAPILFISAGSIPTWSEEEKRKLRAFTDTGGTILLEATGAKPAAKAWFRQLAREVWPEWPLVRLPRDHELWNSIYPLRERRPEVMGIDDGVRTAVFYLPEDVSSFWQAKAFAQKRSLFNWGLNLCEYAKDRTPWRMKLADGEVKKSDKYDGPIQAGGRKTLRIARVRHGGDWSVGANYGGFARLAGRLKEKAGLVLEVTEATQTPVTEGGVAPTELAGYDVAYLAGTKALALTAKERESLNSFSAAGGFLWLEAAKGSAEFDDSVRRFAREMGWELKPLPTTHALMTGRMGAATGYNLTTGVEFRRALRVARLNRPNAEFLGLFEGDRLVGIYSPLDVLFSLTPYEAWACRGYAPADAEAVATNILLYRTAGR